ncbi:N-formylglutamate amidohydrolase [Sphingobacterium faecale]|uniref:N-formylglutamate amidohydrolase n=1 Tax=Sphingobacterium faecale TaxID=2803775 RepID=A0ABS1QZI0_9SPHI|nr:N-formylglutamate amidohydrolase [Sphingobacterium faecale]MBL1407424.1 N-formylglutamate amidohydrolase [Sphingobacterium faecale]
MRKFSFVYGLIFLLLCTSVEAQVVGLDILVSHQSGDILKDKEGWVEVIKGDLPLVLSVPHGGRFKDEQIPDRDCPDLGRVVKGIDMNTKELAMAMQEHFYRQYGKRPYVVIANLSRSKVDQNREIELATCNDPVGIKAWHSYHSAVAAVVTDAKRYGKVFFVDVHGHAHKVQRLELGYNLTTKQLTSAYNHKNTDKMPGTSSLANYFAQGGNKDFYDMLFGTFAFGTLLEKNGVCATPSLQDPHPQEGEAFFSGGHLTRKFTAADFPYVFGVQIEFHFKGIRDTDSNRKKFAEAFAKTYWEFIKNI